MGGPSLLLHDAPNHPTRYDALPFAGAIVADATPVSYGGVYADQYGNVDYVAGSFAPGQFASVNEAEAWATILTLRLVPPRRLWARIEVFTDNQVWDRVMGNECRMTAFRRVWAGPAHRWCKIHVAYRVVCRVCWEPS